jgi:hypothetical protein
MSDDPTRPPYRMMLIPGEPGQAARLAAYRVAYPTVVIRPGEFGTWQALIAESNGETIVVRHTLEALLDRLAALLGEPPGGGDCPDAGRQENTP